MRCVALSPEWSSLASALFDCRLASASAAARMTSRVTQTTSIVFAAAISQIESGVLFCLKLDGEPGRSDGSARGKTANCFIQPALRPVAIIYHFRNAHRAAHAGMLPHSRFLHGQCVYYPTDSDSCRVIRPAERPILGIDPPPAPRVPNFGTGACARRRVTITGE